MTHTLVVAGALVLHAAWLAVPLGALAAVAERSVPDRLATWRERGVLAAIALVFVLPAVLTWVGPPPTAPSLAWVGAAWLGLVGIRLVRVAGGSWLSARRIASGRPAPPAVQQRADALMAARKRSRLLVRLSDEVDTPWLAGVRRPTLLIPSRLAAALDDQALHALLAHEVAHVVRRDLVWNWMLVGVDTLLAPHPSLARLTGRARALREEACDAWSRAEGDAVALARGLATAERLRRAVAGPARRATPLLARVRRLTGDGTGREPWRAQVAAGALVLMAVTGLVLAEGATAVSLVVAGDSLLLAVALGLTTGARHAFEPDHLAALSTLVARSPGTRRAARLGTWWGVGHATALFAVGTILSVTRTHLSEGMASALELGVALMVMGLGLSALLRAHRLGARGRVTWHRHRSGSHAHATTDPHVHLGGWALAVGPLSVGVVHGIAGSGALTALVFSQLATWPTRLAFIALFGLGSTLAMALAAAGASVPLGRLITGPRAAAWVGRLSGATALVVGGAWAVPILARLFP